MAKTISKELQDAIKKLNTAISRTTKTDYSPLVFVTDQKTIKKEVNGKR